MPHQHHLTVPIGFADKTDILLVGRVISPLYGLTLFRAIPRGFAPPP